MLPGSYYGVKLFETGRAASSVYPCRRRSLSTVRPPTMIMPPYASSLLLPAIVAYKKRTLIIRGGGVLSGPGEGGAHATPERLRLRLRPPRASSPVLYWSRLEIRVTDLELGHG